MYKTKPSDEWCTPKWLFDKLNDEFHFDYDVCCTRENCLVEWQKRDDACIDALLGIWPPFLCTWDENGKEIDNFTYFMNPPYSNAGPFVAAAVSHFDRYDQSTIVMLLPLRPCGWWRLFWDFEKNDFIEALKGSELRLLEKRVAFVPPKDFKGKVSSASFACCVIVLRRNND